jgi:predicted amidohydrolase
MTRREFVKLAAASAAAAASTLPVIAEQTTNKANAPVPSKNRMVRILGIPFESREGQVESNVDAAIQIIRREMAKEPFDLVVLPELFTCGYCSQELSSISETSDGPTSRKFAAVSAELDVLIGYGFTESSGKKLVYDSWILIEPDGKRHVYRKTHLHPTAAGGKTNERELFLPGESLGPFVTRLGAIGVMICYDGCFVEVPRVLALKGADFILWPSRSGGYLAGQSLPHVRSLDNAIATVLVEGGQTGPYLPMQCWSAAYSESGSRVISQKNDSAVFRVTIDINAGTQMRASVDAGAHSLYHPRRPELYAAIAQKPGLYQ